MSTSILFSADSNSSMRSSWQADYAWMVFTKYFQRQGQLGPLKDQSDDGCIELIQKTQCGVSAELMVFRNRAFASFLVEISHPLNERHPHTKFLRHLEGGLEGDAAEALKASVMAFGSLAPMTDIRVIASKIAAAKVAVFEVVEVERTD